MAQVQNKCVVQQERLAKAAKHLEQDCNGLTDRSIALRKQIDTLTKLQQIYKSEPTSESIDETEVTSIQGPLTNSMVSKRLQDLTFKSQQTLMRHKIKLKGLRSIQFSAKALANGCLQGLTAHETRTLSRREVGSTVAYAERQIRTAMKRSENQATFDMQKAAQQAVKIGKETASTMNIESLTNKIIQMATTMVYSDASDEAKNEIRGIASTVNLDNLHDHAAIRNAFSKMSELRKAVELASETFQKAATNATRQKLNLEKASNKVRSFETEEEKQLNAADASRGAATQQDIEAIHQETIVNSTELLLIKAKHLTSKMNAGSILRSKAASLLLHELTAARSVLAAAKTELRLIEVQRRPR